MSWRSHRLVRDLSWLSLGQFGRFAAYLLLTSAMARGLGTSGYGAVSVFMAFGAGVAYLASSWAFTALPLLAPTGRALGSVFWAALRVSLAGAAVAALILLPTAWSMLAHGKLVLLLLAVYALGLIGMQGLFAIFQTQGRMSAIALLQAGERTIALTAVFLLVLVTHLTPLWTQVVLAVSPFAVSGIVLMRVARRPQFTTGDPVRAREVTSSVGLLAFITAGAYVVAWVDIVILAAFRSDREVGLYALAYQIFTLVLQLGTLWIVATLPEHARRVSADPPIARHSLTEGPLRTGALGWAAGCGAVALLSSLLLTPVFGHGFRDSLGPLMVLLGGAAILGPYFALVSVLTAERRFRQLAWVTAIGISINVVLDLALVPVIGYWGPAAATAAQNVAVTLAVLVVGLGAPAATRVLLTALPGLAAIMLASWAPTSLALLIVVLAMTLVFTYLAAGTRLFRSALDT